MLTYKTKTDIEAMYDIVSKTFGVPINNANAGLTSAKVVDKLLTSCMVTAIPTAASLINSATFTYTRLSIGVIVAKNNPGTSVGPSDPSTFHVELGITWPDPFSTSVSQTVVNAIVNKEVRPYLGLSTVALNTKVLLNTTDKVEILITPENSFIYSGELVIVAHTDKRPKPNSLLADEVEDNVEGAE